MHKDIQQKYEKDQKERQIERNVSRNTSVGHWPASRDIGGTGPRSKTFDWSRTFLFRHWKRPNMNSG